MKILRLYQPIAIGFFCAVLLSGFTGQEKYVELNSFLQGRYSSDFPEDGTKLELDNSVTTIKAGSTGQILETKKLPSGNYGIHIKVLDGNSKNMNLWVYYNNSHPDLKLFDEAHRPSSDVDTAVETEAVRDTVGTKPPHRAADPKAVTTMIDTSNQRLHQAGTPPCPECNLAAVSHGTRVKPSRTGLHAACSSLMDSQGQLGPDGQKIFSIMAQQKYIQYFTNNNSLGAFCPNFNSLSNAQKLVAWSWLWTVLANAEDGCELNTTHAGPPLNPRVGYGMWAMEKDRKYRVHARGAACNDISTVEGQALCSIDIMAQTQLSHGNSASNKSNGYWGPLNRNDKSITSNMARLNLCTRK